MSGRWEYQGVVIDVGGWSNPNEKDAIKGVDRLTELGRQGWELVNTIPLTQGYGKTAYVVHYLKRAI